MEMTINSRKLGIEVTFSRPGNFYIYVDLNGKSGTHGNQISDYDSTGGGTIGTHSDNQEDFNTICKRWWARYLRNEFNF